MTASEISKSREKDIPKDLFFSKTIKSSLKLKLGFINANDQL